MSIALPPPTRDEPVRPGCGSRRLADRLDRRMPSHAGEARRHGEVELGEALAGDQQRTSDPELGEDTGELRKAPADDHGNLPRAKSTNASATRVRVRPAPEASEISRLASRPSTRASASVPAASSDSTAVREMNVTPYPAATALPDRLLEPELEADVEVA